MPAHMNRSKYLSLMFATFGLILGSACSKKSETTESSSAPAQAQKTQFITIGTGGVTGVYYPTGGAIAKLVNKKSSQNGIKASAQSTAGSIFNINAIMAGDLELGIVQSDSQYQATQGTGEWSNRGKQSKLRAIMSFHSEAITLVAAEDSGVKEVSDLKGKTVNLGNPGSGQRGNALDVLNTSGMNPENDLQAESLKASEAPKMLQDSRLDAFFYTVGHPSGTITEASSGKRQIRFVEIKGMEDLLAKNPFYSKTKIPVKEYPKVANKEDVDTIGVKATLVTSSDVPDEVIYNVTKEIMENFDEFKAQHPAFTNLDKAQVFDALTAPLHPGAEKYFKEAGLMNN